VFSIIIPTFNNLPYLKICISSIKKNSIFVHEIIPHINEDVDGTEEYLISQNIKYTITKYNAGICEGVNTAAKKATTNYILYAHDDFYFCPGWDTELKNEVDKIGHNKFYLSGTMIGTSGENSLDCGTNIENFDEKKLLNNYQKLDLYDFQGSTWAPHLIHRDLWDKVGGFSEEFYPGTGSDPDLNMKLWKANIRIFKGLSKCLVFHFGSVVTRRNNKDDKIKTESGNRGNKIFLIKWGMTIKFFKKFYLKSDTPYTSELTEPKKNINYLFSLFLCKVNYLYVKYIYSLNKN
jgi:glycosyltransferase involved in cell wall biosynthesis